MGNKLSVSVGRALVLEDDLRLQQELAALLCEKGFEVRSCGTVHDAMQVAQQFSPTLVLLDFSLPDGDSRPLLQALRALPRWPMLIAISGLARPDQAFDLALLGVRCFLPKPITPADIERALTITTSQPLDLEPSLRSAVGLVPVHDVQEQVRATMLNEALGQSNGNRSRAARLLSVSRQLLQHMLRTTRHVDDALRRSPLV